MMHIYFVSLGCDKNLVDSEKMLALLTKEGYELTDEPEQAEIIVVNTCAFIHDAKQESIETLLELAEYKKTGKCKVLIASGCLAERYQDTILEEMPEIDGVIGTTAYDDIAVVVKKALGGEHAGADKRTGLSPGSPDRPRYLRYVACWLFKDQRRLQQKLYVLYYSIHERPLPKCTDGRFD